MTKRERAKLVRGIVNRFHDLAENNREGYGALRWLLARAGGCLGDLPEADLRAMATLASGLCRHVASV